MKKLLSFALAAVLCLPMSAVTVHTIGDSTMQDYDESTTPTRGWATYLGSFFDANYVTVNNRGKAGTSSRTFYTGAAFWTTVKQQMTAGDYVIIQFAHNDENNNGMDALEYNAYLRAQGQDTLKDLRGTVPQTTYKAFLRKYVNETRALNCNPVLMAPICRFWFKNGAVSRSGQHDLGDKFDKLENGVYSSNNSLPADDHTMDYVQAMREVATEMNVPFIDLTAATKEMYEQYGDPDAKNLMGNGQDGTHLGAMGANLIARRAAQLLKDAGILAQYISIPTDISANPNRIDIGEVYSGVAVNRELLLTGYGLEPAAGNVAVSVTGSNLTISTDGENFAATAQAAYEGSTLFQKLFIRAIYTAAGEQADSVIVLSGSTRLAIPVTASVISLDGGAAVSATWAIEAQNTWNEVVVTGPIAADMTLSSMCTWAAETEYQDGEETISMVRFHHAVNGTKTAWPAGEIDENESRYIDFAVTAPTTHEIRVTNINMLLASRSTATMCCHINTGIGDGMLGVQTIYEKKNMPNSSVIHVGLTPTLTIPAGETLHVRVLPWHDAAEAKSGKYICLKNVVIEGQAFEAEAMAIDHTPFPLGEGRGEASKLLRNGQLLILRDGKTYNALGQLVN